MKNYLIIFIATVVLATVSCRQHHEQSPEEYQEEVKQQIATVDKLWMEAWENEDLDSVMFFLDEGFLNMFGFGPTAWNKERCREGFKNVFDAYSVEGVEYKTIEFFVDQNYAFETQLFKQKFITNDIQDTTYFDMRTLTVYKKQDDGSWKLFWLMGQE
ncbi:MAG: hypothetical protein JW833_00590 [Prolixibacteraceae bacterium]|nr:hypothetical protein [Prolixibacteraceae bacterium]